MDQLRTPLILPLASRPQWAVRERHQRLLTHPLPIMEAGKRAPHTQTPPRSATGQVPAFHLAALPRVRWWSRLYGVWLPGSCPAISLAPVDHLTEDPRRCPIRVVLSFLQQGLERRLSPSTLMVYVAEIAANHDPVEGKSVGKHDWVVRFLRGSKKAESSTPPLYTLLGPVSSAQSTTAGPVRAFADSRAKVPLNENSAPACTGLH